MPMGEPIRPIEPVEPTEQIEPEEPVEEFESKESEEPIEWSIEESLVFIGISEFFLGLRDRDTRV